MEEGGRMKVPLAKPRAEVEYLPPPPKTNQKISLTVAHLLKAQSKAYIKPTVAYCTYTVLLYCMNTRET